MKDRPLSKFALDMDGASHLCHKVFHDGKPQSFSAFLFPEPLHRGIGLKQLRKEFLRHANPRIFHDNMEPQIFPLSCLEHLYLNPVPGTGIFHRIGKKLVQNLRKV